MAMDNTGPEDIEPDVEEWVEMDPQEAYALPKRTGTSAAPPPGGDGLTLFPPRVTFAEFMAKIGRPLPKRLIKQRMQGGSMIDYVPWPKLVRLLSWASGGYYSIELTDRQVEDFTSWKNVPVEGSKKKEWRADHPYRALMLTVRLTVYCADGVFSVDGEGIARDDEDSGFGDMQSNAKAMALRRALANWGGGLELWED